MSVLNQVAAVILNVMLVFLVGLGNVLYKRPFCIPRLVLFTWIWISWLAREDGEISGVNGMMCDMFSDYKSGFLKSLCNFLVAINIHKVYAI